MHQATRIVRTGGRSRRVENRITMPLAGALVLWAALVGGCSGVARDDRAPAAEAGQVDLADAVAVRQFSENPETGLLDQVRWTFLRRDDGSRIDAGSLRFDADGRAVVVLSSTFHEGLAVAGRDGSKRVGYVDLVGRTVIPMRFVSAGPFNGGRAIVRVDEGDGAVRCGMIDRQGRWIVRPGRFDDLGVYREGRCAFEVDGKWGLIDGQGNIVVDATYTQPPVSHQGVASVHDENGRPVYIDRDGKTVITLPDAAVTAGDFHNGVAWIGIAPAEDRDNSPWSAGFGDREVRYGLIAINGEVILEPTYRQVNRFSDGLAAVSRDSESPVASNDEPMRVTFDDPDQGRWGFVDVQGRVAIPLEFEQVGRFREGLARAKKNGQWGYINPAGDWAVEPRFDWARDFTDGLAEVWAEGEIVLIDRSGSIVLRTGLSAVTF